MILTRKIILVAATLLVLGLAVSASAGIVAQKSSFLIGTLASGTGLTCNAVVSLDGGVYTYDYTLVYLSGLSDIHTFKVQNPNVSAFFGATNQPSGSNHFTDPANGTDAWVTWVNGTMTYGAGSIRTFSYQSYYAPMEIDVYTQAIDSGKSATGKTLGMGTTIPEPSSMAAFLFGTAGLLPLVIRRRK